MSDYTGKGKSNEWYTPEFIFKSINILFDLDPCSPKGIETPSKKWCKEYYSKSSLEKDWHGMVFMNPPWSGKQNAIVPWLEKFTNHGNGVAIFPARTSCGWWQEYVPRFDGILFPSTKTKFIPGDGVIASNPMAGVTIGAIGPEASRALRESGLGIFLEIDNA